MYCNPDILCVNDIGNMTNAENPIACTVLNALGSFSTFPVIAKSTPMKFENTTKSYVTIDNKIYTSITNDLSS
jgi:hypothetical protein